MIAATVRTELRNLFREVCKPAGLHQLIEPRRQRVLRIVVAHMRRVLAMRRPLRRDAERRHIVGVRSTMAADRAASNGDGPPVSGKWLESAVLRRILL